MNGIQRLLCCSSTMDSGGSERQTWNLLRGIDRAKFDPRLYLLYEQGPLLHQLPHDVSVEAFWSRRRSPTLNWPGRLHRMQIADLTNLIRRDRIDVVYERLFHMAMLAGPAAKRTGVRHVANIVSPPRSDVPRSEIKFAWLKRHFLSRAYREADRLLAVSRGAADDASAYYGIARNRFEVVWNPVDLERVDRLKNEAWCGKPWANTSFKIVSVGRLSREKGHENLIRAFAEVSQRLQDFLSAGSTTQTDRNDLEQAYRRSELHLVGDGPLLKELQSLTTELGLDKHVVFHGYVDNPFPLVHRSQLFVLPSLYEGLPNALLEAMACEVPTVATDCPGGIREATQDGKLTCLVAPNDRIAMSQAIIQRVIAAESFVDRVSLARQRIETEHGYDAWLRLMESILSGQARTQLST